MLVKHTGNVHKMISDIWDVYFQRLRRYVYVTPKSYLSFL